nr:RNA-directed DNA polymerase, eukaryota [Tanacetum cinerariifolium]
MVDGMWIESPNRVKGEFFHHVSSRFDKPDARRAHIEMRYPKTLTCDQHVELESDVSNEEIKRAVWDCGIDKSPSPDGFTFGFYRRFCNLIENDVYDAVKYFFTYGVIPKGCNSSFIALIPKIPDANTVDFEKAYDSVRWDFLDDILKFFGFGEKWCIKLSSSLSISHMFYADDAVFVGQWCDGNITTLVHVLECFYRASGLRINMSKSKIMGVIVDSDKVKCAASILGCPIPKTPFSYLGSKVGGSMSRVHTWNEVVDRVKNRLSKWKMKTLSIGCRLTLLKSVLGSMPIFHMSIFRSPLIVLRTLESIRSQFFKGQELNSKKASWVNWKKVLALKEKGGLGVSSLYALNRGLMFKWMWRFYMQNTSLWVLVIKAIHGDGEKVGGYVKDGAKSYWLSIVNEITSLKNNDRYGLWRVWEIFLLRRLERKGINLDKTPVVDKVDEEEDKGANEERDDEGMKDEGDNYDEVDLRDGICPLCNSRNSYVHDSDPNSFDCPPEFYNPLHPTYESYSGDSCGNDPQFGYDCPPQFPLNYEPKPGYSQNYNSYPHDSPSFPQQYPCCDDCEACQIVQKKLEKKRIEEEQAATAQNRKLPVCYDDDDDEEESNSLK